MRALTSLASVLVLAALLAGCGQQQKVSEETTADSLLASNPIEQPPAGDINPSTEYQEPAKEETPPAPAPTRKPSKPSSKPRPAPTTESAPVSRGVTLPAGTPLKVVFDAKVSSATAQPGDTWTGTIKEPVIIGTNAPIPAGSRVTGVVSGAAPAQKGSRAFLVLAVKSIDVNGKSHSVAASTDSIVAGSTRARNLGAIAGGAAAGALIGKAVGGSNKGALIGGLLGGAAATGAVAASKGYQVEMKEGAELTFTVNEAVVMQE
jgi:hypothetical protein